MNIKTPVQPNSLIRVQQTTAEFKLDEDFLDSYAHKRPNFGFNGLGELVYFRTYSRVKPDGSKESFVDTVQRVVEGCYEIQRRHCASLHIPWDSVKAQESAQEMFQRIWDFKFTPPGRGLWMMGTDFMWDRGSSALNNCFSGDTEIITRDGIKQIGALAGTTQTLLTVGGKWVDAPIRSFGNQELYKLTLGRSGVEKVIYTTADHIWFARDRRYQEDQKFAAKYINGGTTTKTRTSAFQEFKTTELRSGIHCLRYTFGQGIKGNVRPSPFGIAHGIAFGDGTTGHHSDGAGTYLYLCGQKNEELLQYFPNCPATPDLTKGSEGAIRVADLPKFFRRKPNLRESKSYLYGWLAGYFAADGKINTKGNSPTLSSSKRENLEAAREVCSILGIGTYSITGSWHKIRHSDGRVTKYYGYEMALMAAHLVPEFFLLEEHKSRFENWSSHRDRPVYSWRVKSVEPTGEIAEVFCPQVPDYAAFTLADNILTRNCGFVSTDDLIESDPAEPFCFLMDMSMLGVGVGFDTKGAGKIRIEQPSSYESTLYVIQDSREGWVDSVRALIRSYTIETQKGRLTFDYSMIREPGSPINGFGGKASGPGILRELHELIAAHLDRKVGSTLTSVDITDIMNYIGRCVVAGNVRRTAEIAFGDADDKEYCQMKNPVSTLLETDKPKWYSAISDLYAQGRYTAKLSDFLDESGELIIPRERLEPAIQVWSALNHHRWASNNSVFARQGMNYESIAEQIASNGEPGLMWLEHMRDYGRMIDGKQPGIDKRVKGGNPCLTGDMKLLTEQGYISIYDLWLQSGCQEYDGTDNALSKYGSQHIVNANGVVEASNVYRTGVNVPVHRVKFDDGSYIDATDNHTMITLVRKQSKKKGKTTYVESRKKLSELETGDLIPLNHTVHFGDFDDPTYAELAGWCIGDGSLSTKKDGQIKAECTCYNADIQFVLPELRELLFSLYESHNLSTSQELVYAGHDINHQHFDHHEKWLSSNVLGRLLRDDGIIPGRKHAIPFSIWRGTKATVAAFLRGFASADSCVLPHYGNGTISVRIKQSDYDILHGCKLLLTQFGIHSKVLPIDCEVQQYVNDGKGGHKKSSYELIVSGINQVRQFIDNIGFIQESKTQKAMDFLQKHPGSNNSSTGRYVKVESIEAAGFADVYCLTEPQDNRLVVEGYQIGNCLEQSLESYELCCLVETFPAHHTDPKDYLRTLKYAYLYAKAVTLLPTHNPRTNQVMMRNRRIGLSQSGIIQAFAKFGRRAVLNDFCDAGYKEVRHWDEKYSEWLCVPHSIKVTSIKPSGSVSLLAGATPGIHHPEASTYWRRVRLAKDSILVKILTDAGYEIEPAISDPDRTVVAKFAVSDPHVRPVDEVTIWEQVANAVDYQRYWADNQVSCTVKFKSSERAEIARVLESFEDQLKGISFLPMSDHGYAQAPYEPCTPEEAIEYNNRVKPADYSAYIMEAVGAKYCDGDTCEM